MSVYHFLTKPRVISTINLAWPHSRCFYSARVTHKKLNGYLLHTIGSNLRQYQFIDYFPKRAAIKLNSDYDIIFSAVNMGNRKICSVGYVRVPLAYIQNFKSHQILSLNILITNLDLKFRTSFIELFCYISFSLIMRLIFLWQHFSK